MAAIKAALVRPTYRKEARRAPLDWKWEMALEGLGRWEVGGGRWEDEQEQELRALHEIVVREAARPCNCALSAWRLPESGVLPYGKHCMR